MQNFVKNLYFLFERAFFIQFAFKIFPNEQGNSNIIQHMKKRNTRGMHTISKLLIFSSLGRHLY